jgi:hypothetical protein
VAVPEIVATLRLDLADLSATLFTDEVLRRCVLKGVGRVASDLKIALRIAGFEIEPEPGSDAVELLAILGQIHACQHMRAATANSFSFSSADKRVDKTRQPEHWAALEESLWATYRARLKELAPGAVPDDYLLTPSGLKPVVYEQGASLDAPQ